MNKIVVILSILIIGLSSCKKKPQSNKTQEQFIAELETAPDTIAIGNNVFVLNVYLVRNFMPVCEENGDPMYCVSELRDVNSGEIQNITVLKRNYVINGGELWSQTITQTNTGGPNTVTGASYGGPKWEPDTPVDVVCEFEYQGVTRKIISKSQNINAVF